jgi:ATP-binding cassette subfamily B protein
MYDLRKEIFEHLQRLPMSFFDRSPVGRLVTRATTDVDALNDLFASGVVAMLNDFVLLFAMAAILFKWHPFLALATLSPLPFMILLTYFFRNKVRNANRRIRTAIARINAFLQEHISGMAIVQLFNREWKSRKQFEELNRQHMEAYKEAIDAFSFFYPAVEFLSMAGPGVAVLGGWTQGHCRDDSDRRPAGIHALCPTVFPADPGLERKIQYFADGHGCVRTNL